MQIKLVEIGNFRKLQKVRIDLAEKTTVFVGANNSGKTSAMVALRHFLVGRTDFSINDFTLSNWAKFDVLGQQWEAQKAGEPEPPFDWNTVLPHLDVWLDVQEGELHYVQKILPTLDWAGALIGVRLRYEPKDDQAFKAAYLNAKLAAEEVMRANAAAEEPPKADSQGADGFALWPRSLMDFLSVKPLGDRTVEATKRLFYVTASRAKKSLALVAYSASTERVKSFVLNEGWFAPREIISELVAIDRLAGSNNPA